MNVICYDGLIHTFHNTLSEDSKMFIDRTWYIVKNLNKYKDIDYLVNLSFLWINKKYYNIEYVEDIEKLIT